MATNNPSENPTLRHISSYLYPPDRRGTQPRVLREPRATRPSAIPGRKNHLTFSIAGGNSPSHQQSGLPGPQRDSGLSGSRRHGLHLLEPHLTCLDAALRLRLRIDPGSQSRRARADFAGRCAAGRDGDGADRVNGRAGMNKNAAGMPGGSACERAARLRPPGQRFCRRSQVVKAMRFR